MYLGFQLLTLGLWLGGILKCLGAFEAAHTLYRELLVVGTLLKGLTMAVFNDVVAHN